MARRLYREGFGIEVFEIEAHARQRVALLIGDGGPLIALSRAIVGTALEVPALRWALERVIDGAPAGIYFWFG
jgi:hypothetical protein